MEGFEQVMRASRGYIRRLKEKLEELEDEEGLKRHHDKIYER